MAETGNRCGPEGARELAAVLHGTQLTQLGLSCKFAKFLCIRSLKCPWLTNLHNFTICITLPGNDVGVDGALSLAACLPRSQLTQLDLECTYRMRAGGGKASGLHVEYGAAFTQSTIWAPKVPVRLQTCYHKRAWRS